MTFVETCSKSMYWTSQKKKLFYIEDFRLDSLRKLNIRLFYKFVSQKRKTLQNSFISYVWFDWIMIIATILVSILINNQTICVEKISLNSMISIEVFIILKRFIRLIYRVSIWKLATLNISLSLCIMKNRSDASILFPRKAFKTDIFNPHGSTPLEG